MKSNGKKYLGHISAAVWSSSNDHLKRSTTNDLVTRSDVAKTSMKGRIKEASNQRCPNKSQLIKLTLKVF